MVRAGGAVGGRDRDSGSAGEGGEVAGVCGGISGVRRGDAGVGGGYATPKPEPEASVPEHLGQLPYGSGRAVAQRAHQRMTGSSRCKSVMWPIGRNCGIRRAPDPLLACRSGASGSEGARPDAGRVFRSRRPGAGARTHPGSVSCGCGRRSSCRATRRDRPSRHMRGRCRARCASRPCRRRPGR